MFTTATTTHRTSTASGSDWGPARHDPEHPLHSALLDSDPFSAVALRDGDDARPDDN
ncbi:MULTISPECIES: hypothetical protein [unclassified Nocardioides]|uniref:hypothetical protein n=1 Tax=unclassified Nocardioides TaxID=2615069 RepID=UPI000B04B8E5|nr:MULTISPECIES: hypothetical protein [unclassified Nocardioides]